MSYNILTLTTLQINMVGIQNRNSDAQCRCFDVPMHSVDVSMFRCTVPVDVPMFRCTVSMFRCSDAQCRCSDVPMHTVSTRFCWSVDYIYTHQCVNSSDIYLVLKSTRTTKLTEIPTCVTDYIKPYELAWQTDI